MDSAIGRVASILRIPYGYTVSLWCAGALVVGRYGFPSSLVCRVRRSPSP